MVDVCFGGWVGMDGRLCGAFVWWLDGRGWMFVLVAGWLVEAMGNGFFGGWMGV